MYVLFGVSREADSFFIDKGEKMFFEEKFFEKEIRCGFEIPELMKRAWAAQMEVLQVVIDICQNNKLRYYATGGTLLGAVRHKGYIPWDDDIDIALIREDYNELIKILPEQLPYGFVIGGIFSPEKKYWENTKCDYLMVMSDRELWKTEEYIQRFHGYPFNSASIDIFPLDHVPSDKKAYEVQNSLISMGLTIIDNWDVLEERKKLIDEIKKFEQQSSISLNRQYMKYDLLRTLDAIMSMYLSEEGDELDTYGWDCKIRSLKWYESQIIVPFENMEIAIPNGYEEVLTAIYGDWKKFEYNGAAHDYPYYREMEADFRKRLKADGISYTLEEFCKKLYTAVKQQKS